ncbi:MAG: mechanosensitive ion channel domain-containing protein [Promethearchaeota archaeon]
MFWSIFQGTNPIDEFLGILGSFNIAGWSIPIMGLILLVGIIVAIYIVYKYIFRKLNKRIVLQGSTPDIYNGLKFGVRLMIGIIIIILIMTFLQIDSSYILIVSGIVVSAIAFASMNAINNFIVGIWLLLARPFTVGDYVNINGSDGIVVEISLNYTKVKHIDETISLIPNINCVNTNIINHTISKKWLEQYIKRLQQTREKLQSILEEEKKEFKVINEIREESEQLQETLKMMENMEESFFLREKGTQLEKISHSKYVQKNKLVRYVLELNLDKRVKRNEGLLEEICQKWSDKFLIKPYWQLYGADFYAYYRFILLTPDPQFLIRYLGEFIKDIYKAIYTEDK